MLLFYQFFVFYFYIMSSDKKTIKINPDFFKVNNSINKTIKHKKPKHKPAISTKCFKSEILKRIQKHKQKELAKKKISFKNNHQSSINSNINNEIKENAENISNELDDSINYLNNLSKNYNQSKLNNKTLKHKNINKSQSQKIDVNIELPEELIEYKEELLEPEYDKPLEHKEVNKYKIVSNEVPYGILKNGNKPTYRQYYNKTLKKKTRNSTNYLPPTINSSSIKNSDELVKNSDELVKNSDEPINVTNNFNKNSNNYENQPKKRISKRISKKTYTLGKIKNKRKIGVLIKNKKTQKNIISAYRDLSKTPIHEVKKYLHKRNLIKIGGATPHNICRDMYAAVKMTGEVNNINNDTMIHNIKHNEEE